MVGVGVCGSVTRCFDKWWTISRKSSVFFFFSFYAYSTSTITRSQSTACMDVPVNISNMFPSFNGLFDGKDVHTRLEQIFVLVHQTLMQLLFTPLNWIHRHLLKIIQRLWIRHLFNRQFWKYYFRNITLIIF